jgi:hypothetical protein
VEAKRQSKKGLPINSFAYAAAPLWIPVQWGSSDQVSLTTPPIFLSVHT